MRVDKVYNNNVIQAINKRDEEVIVMGRGIGFGKKVGDQIEMEKVDKIFVLDNDNLRFSEIYRDLSPEEVDLVLAIIDYAEKELSQALEPNVYVTIADHLHFAVERYHQGITLRNPLRWEVKKFYKKEYDIGKAAIERVNTQLSIELHEDEAASIALHLVNAQKEGALVEQTVRITQIVQDIINIVRLHYGYEFDEDSISYNRFVTHLQYFANRVMEGIQVGENDSFLFDQVQLSYPEAFSCSQKIKYYIEKSYDYVVGSDEQVYLTIHIQRLTTK